MKVLMCPPTFFKVQWEINPFMDKNNQPDPLKARLEWLMLIETYLQLGVEVKILRPRPNLHDMVYTANAGWGRKSVFILSKFRHKERRDEIKFYEEWFKTNGFKAIKMPNRQDEPPYFEGQGDLITTNKEYLFGWGIRSSFAAGKYISENLFLGRKIISLQLINKNFYHLDTCFFSWKPLDFIMYYPQAFNSESLKKIKALDLDKIEVTREEAMNLVCNSVYYETTAIISGAGERLLEQFQGRKFMLFRVKSIEDLPLVFKEYRKISKKTPKIIVLPKPTELLKAGGSYRCCSLFLD